MILSYTLILPVSQLQTATDDVTEDLIQTYNILVLILFSKLLKNIASLTVSNTIS